MAFVVRRAADTDPSPIWDVGSFSDDDIAAAVAKVAAIPGYPAEPDRLPVLWPAAKKMPTAADIDFGDAKADTVTLADLRSSNASIKRDRLLWHVQHPGQRLRANPLTTMPLVADTDDGPVIVDGHHSLGALLLLGAESAPVWLLPKP